MTEEAARAAAKGWVGAGDDISPQATTTGNSSSGANPEVGEMSPAAAAVMALGDEGAAGQLNVLQLALLRSGLRRLVGNLRLLHQAGEEVMDSMVRTGCC